MINTVLSLLLTRSDRPEDLLLGIRDPRVNPRHPNVLSTITQRVPDVFLDQFDLTIPRTSPNSGPLAQSQGHALIAGPRPRGQIGRTGPRNLLSFAVETVLCRKLDLGSELEAGRIIGEAELCAITCDLVGDPLGTDQFEETIMLTAKVRIEAGADLIPTLTTSYSRLEWVDVSELTEAVRQRDPLRLINDVDPIAVCLHGLCVRAAAGVVADDQLGLAARRLETAELAS